MTNMKNTEDLLREAVVVIEEMLAAQHLFERPSRAIVQQAEKLLSDIKAPPVPRTEAPSNTHCKEPRSTQEALALDDQLRVRKIVTSIPRDLLSGMAMGLRSEGASKQWIELALLALHSSDWRQEIEKERTRAEKLDGDLLSARAWMALKAHLVMVENLVCGVVAEPLGPMNIRALEIGAQHFGDREDAQVGWFHGVAHMCKRPTWAEKTTGLSKATVGVSIFGNPIPQAWYVAANQLQDECKSALLEGVQTAVQNAKPSIRWPAP